MAQTTQKDFYHAGFQLGRAKDVERFNNTVAALQAEVNSAEVHHTVVITNTSDAVQTILNNFEETANKLEKQVDGMVQKHLQFVKQLEIETAIWAAMQPPPSAEHYVKQREKGFKIFEDCEQGFQVIAQTLENQVRQVRLSDKLEEMKVNLRKYLETEVETARNNLRDFRKGYNEGAGIRQQMDDLDGTSGSGQ